MVLLKCSVLVFLHSFLNQKRVSIDERKTYALWWWRVIKFHRLPGRLGLCNILGTSWQGLRFIYGLGFYLRVLCTCKIFTRKFHRLGPVPHLYNSTIESGAIPMQSMSSKAFEQGFWLCKGFVDIWEGKILDVGSWAPKSRK